MAAATCHSSYNILQANLNLDVITIRYKNTQQTPLWTERLILFRGPVTPTINRQFGM